MIHALDTIINIFTTIIDIVVGLIQSIIQLFLQIGRAIAMVTKIMGYLPQPFVVACTGILGLLILINILNKGG